MGGYTFFLNLTVYSLAWFPFAPSSGHAKTVGEDLYVVRNGPFESTLKRAAEVSPRSSINYVVSQRTDREMALPLAPSSRRTWTQ